MPVTKEDIDQVFSTRYTDLSKQYKLWKPKSKHNIDKDVLAFVYEDMLHTINKIPDQNSIYRYMVQSLRMFMFYGNTKYTREYRNYNGGLDVGEWINNTIEFSDVDPLLDTPDPHLQLIQFFTDLNTDLVDSLAFKIQLDGYNTLSKFAKYTGIPKSTSYRIFLAIRSKLQIIKNLYMDNPSHKYIKNLGPGETVTRSAGSYGTYTISGDTFYTQEELHNLYPFFSGAISIMDLTSEQLRVAGLAIDPKPKNSKVTNKLKEHGKK